MKTNPRFSVITPSFNQGAYIERTIDSVLSQGYENLEYIIIDGGSTDQSVEIIKKYERHLKYWVSEKDRGQSHAINKGLALATGEYVTWLNSDDWYLPDTISRVSDAFMSHPTAGLVVGTGEMVDLEGNTTEIFSPPAFIDKATLLNWFDGSWFLQPAAFFRRSVWEHCGPLDEEQHLVFDIAMFLAAADRGFTYHTIPHTLARALRHEQAKTSANSWQVFLEGAVLMESHGKSGEVAKVFDRLTKRLENASNAIEWYERNYTITVQHPLVRLIRPLAKLMASSDDQFWRDSVPAWIRQKP